MKKTYTKIVTTIKFQYVRTKTFILNTWETKRLFIIDFVLKKMFARLNSRK